MMIFGSLVANVIVDAKGNGEDVQMDKSEDDLLVDDFDIFRDL
jgi:hypothetical protein